MSRTHSTFRFNLDKQKVEAKMNQSAKRGLKAALDYLATESKKQVPLDKGPLQHSCYVDISSDGKSGTVSYDTPYAVRQHEERGYHHQRGRKAKYLEDPVNSKAIRDNMRELMRREGGFR